MSPWVSDYPRYLWQLLNGFRAHHERTFAALRKQDIAPYVNTKAPITVLDLANGRLRPQYTLLKAAGYKVHGVDRVNRPTSNWVDCLYKFARFLYVWQLRVSPDVATYGTLVCADVCALPFRNNRFDLVSSIAAFEHFLDVPRVIAELHRIIKPGGLAWICIHLFASPSGGHNVSFTQIPLRTLPAGVDVWDHLRRRELPFSVPLNEWRKDQYLKTFEGRFEILKHYCALREGEQFLTREIRAELSAYTVDELTCAAYVILMRKPL